jgi:putative alpha-1,2-mannosidase
VNSTTLAFPHTSSPSKTQAGALLSFDATQVIARFGVSFISSQQACSNAESEIPDWNWNGVQMASSRAWNDFLERVEIDTGKENSTVVELLYSSVTVLLRRMLCLTTY